ncbi:MAG: chemotaxis protein CheB [Fuerstiella sp.]
MTEPAKPAAEPPKFIVGVGVSAGGLEALERLFRTIPTDVDMAFVVIQHLSPDFDSMMNELLIRQTQIPVHIVSQLSGTSPPLAVILLHCSFSAQSR